MSHQGETGQCPRCQSANPYAMSACVACGSRLPWANTVESVRRETAERAAQEQADKLAVAQAQAKAAKAEARLQTQTTISQRTSSPVAAVVVWVFALSLIGCIAFAAFQANQDVRDYRKLDEPRHSSAASGTSLSLAAYNQLSTGMSPESATAILGPPTTSGSAEVGGVTTLGLHWVDGGAMISASFQDGGLVTKSQSGL